MDNREGLICAAIGLKRLGYGLQLLNDQSPHTYVVENVQPLINQ